MTGADLVSIHVEYMQTFFEFVTLLSTILFAYFVATYLVSERLTWPQLALLSTLFLAFLSSLASGAARTVRQINAIETEILHRIAQADSGLGWLDATVVSGGRTASSFFYFWTTVGVIAVGFAVSKKWRSGAATRAAAKNEANANDDA